MADLVRRSAPGSVPGAPVVSITPSDAGWTYVGFEVRRLAAGERHTTHAPDRELCIVVLSGSVTITAGAEAWTGVGGRTSVFDGLPDAVYAPAATTVELVGVTDCEVALCSAPGIPVGAPCRLPPEGVAVEQRGAGNARREVRPILMPDRAAQSLLVVEVITPAGHWSSFPPHKHDVDDPPTETFLEETYYHRTAGFACQRVYTDDRSLDETMTVTDGDVVLVPRGYHTVSAPPGYDLYYLNVMAGPVRAWAFTDDPDHHWLAAAR